MFYVYAALRDQRESLSLAHVASVDLRDADGRAVSVRAAMRADLGLADSGLADSGLKSAAPIAAADPPKRRLALRWPLYFRAVAR